MTFSLIWTYCGAVATSIFRVNAIHNLELMIVSQHQRMKTKRMETEHATKTMFYMPAQESGKERIGAYPFSCVRQINLQYNMPVSLLPYRDIPSP